MNPTSLIRLAAVATVALGAPLAAQTTSYGNGCFQVPAFSVPLITPVGTPVQGQQMRLDMSGAPGPGLLALLVGTSNQITPLAPFGFPGCDLNVGVANSGTVNFAVPFTSKVSLPITGWAAGYTLYAQTVYLPNVGGYGISRGLQMSSVQATPNLSVKSAAPSSGGLGTTLGLAGSSFRNLASLPADFLVYGKGPRGFLTRVSDVLDTGIVCKTTHHPHFPTSTPITVIPGKGASKQLSTPTGFPPLKPIRVWSGKSSNGNTSTATFKPDQIIPTAGCSGPKYFVDYHPTLVNGEACFTFPSDTIVTGDKLEFDIILSNADGTLTRVTMIDADAITIGTSMNWSVFGLGLQGILQGSLDATLPSTPFNVTINGNTLCIGNTGNPVIGADLIGYVRVTFDPNQNLPKTVTQGVPDGFSTGNGVEAAQPDSAWKGLMNAWLGPVRHCVDYDVNQFNVDFCDTMTGIKATPKVLRSAMLEVRIRGVAAETNTDAFAFGWNGGPVNNGPWYPWSSKMISLATLNFAWTPGSDATLCFDLSELPTVDQNLVLTTLTNMLGHQRLQNDALEVWIQDDTMVDYLKLTTVCAK